MSGRARALVLLATCHGVAAPAAAQSPAEEPSGLRAHQITDVAVPVTLGFAGAHAIDNVISRRTFTSDTIGPTIVQLNYVALAVAWALDAGPLYYIVHSVAILTIHTLSHYAFPSSDAHISTFHEHWASGDNRLDARSGAMGRISQIVLVGLDLSFLTVLVSSIADAARCGLTLVRDPECAR